MRRKTRTIFTVLSIVVAFLLFGILAALNVAFGMGVELAGNDRLIIMHKVSIIQLLPESYEARLEATPGVVDVLHQTWFGGIYQKPEQLLHADARCDPERLLKLYPEYLLPEDQKKAWLADRTGAIVGRQTADRFGWKVGRPRCPSRRRSGARRTAARPGSSTSAASTTATRRASTRRRSSSTTTTSTRRGSSARAWSAGTSIRIDDPAAGAATIAERIDAQFANSFAETKTTTEKAFVQAFAKQIGDIGAIIRGIVTAVFFTILLVAANTMAQSVRERTSELAVLKTLGFSRRARARARARRVVRDRACSAAAVGLGLAWRRHAGRRPDGRHAPGVLPAHAPTSCGARCFALGARAWWRASCRRVAGDAAAHRRRAEEELAMRGLLGWLSQVVVVTLLNLRTIGQRLTLVAGRRRRHRRRGGRLRRRAVDGGGLPRRRWRPPGRPTRPS